MPLARGADGRLGVAASAAARRGEHHRATSRRRTPTASAAPRPISPARSRARWRAASGDSEMPAFHEVLFPLDIALEAARAGRSGAPRSSRSAPAARSAMRAGRIRAGATMPATASRRFEALSQVDRVLRGAARPAAWLSLARPARSFVRRAGRGGDAARPDRSASATASTRRSQLCKTYGARYAPYPRPIAKPVAGSVRVAVGGVEVRRGRGFHRRRGDRRRDVSRRANSGGGRGGDGGLPVRRAGALRHRLSRGRSVGLRGRRDPENPAGGDQSL